MKSWPFVEAQKLLNAFPEKKEFIFETGYGPSGLPHIGTFGEVARTTMVMHALRELKSDVKTKLIAFSDDMDGLRKVPDNIPNKEGYVKYIGMPLTAIPDPFATHASYGEHMNARLCKFLDLFDFDYEFKSSTTCYKSGLFDEKLLLLLANYDKVMKIMLPSLGQERQASYSPFLPICQKTGKVLQVPIIAVDAENGTITYHNEAGHEITTMVTGGNCKLQWKPDWGMRWAALQVDYEMHGKDLTPSAVLSKKTCSILSDKTPQLFVYELFLDAKGRKISKSKGNGIAIEEWLKYAPPESLALYMFQQPSRAKRLYFDVIPKAVDEYCAFVKSYKNGDVDNPAWHIHGGTVPAFNNYNITFSVLLNLATACNPEDESVMWGFINNYQPEANPDNSPMLKRLVSYAVKYYHDFINPQKRYEKPNAEQREMLLALKSALLKLEDEITAEVIQQCVYDVGMKYYEKINEWFKLLYKILLGQDKGPRMGSFISLYGLEKTIELINNRCAES